VLASWGCKDNCREDAFGLKAEIVEQELDALQLKMQKVKNDGSFQNFVYNCFVADVCPWDDEALQPLVKKSINTLTDGEKRFMVKQVWGNSQGKLLGALKNGMLSDEDLVSIHEFMQWQYQMPDVALAAPCAVKLACFEGASTVEGSGCILELKELMQTKRIVVFPIHADLHWTVVVLEMEEIGSMKVKRAHYFDWMEPCVARHRNFARKLLRLLTISAENQSFLELPVKHNKFRQRPGSNDCGFVVWYALEVFMKQRRMEGTWTLLPRPDLWRDRLQTFQRSLLKEQQAWALEDMKEKSKMWKPKFEIVRPGSKKTGDKNEEKAMLHLKWQEGKVIVKRKEYFGCPRCRWSTFGEGCESCNPAKAEKLKAVKDKEIQHLQNVVASWYAMLQEKGILVDHVPADQKPESKDMKGGGGTMGQQLHAFEGRLS